MKRMPDFCLDSFSGWSVGGLVGRLGADGRGLFSLARSRVRNSGGPGGYGGGGNTLGIGGRGWYGFVV